MARPFFLITIDTEGDNLWARPREITTRNAEYIPRFQTLCERYGVRPTYLTNYEMAASHVFQEFARDLLSRGGGEVGMHLHAWDSPPLRPLTDDDFRYHPYLTEFLVGDMREKVVRLTELLESTFGVPIRSHRAGRWALDERYARLLTECGYCVDCSVTPGVSWHRHLGDPNGRGGADYRSFPSHSYFVNLDRLSHCGSSRLLEVPVTIIPDRRAVTRGLRRLAADVPPMLRVVNRLAPPVHWLRPNGRNRRTMLSILLDSVVTTAGYAQMVLHSSELMPAGSPTFPTVDSIERLYEDLELLLAHAAGSFRPATLMEFYDAVSRVAG